MLELTVSNRAERRGEERRELGFGTHENERK
jgi:hypothetical protein